MLSLKKTTVAILALGSSAVFAGTMGPVCTPGNVTVPCASTAWDVGGQALYFQTMTDDRVTLSDVLPATGVLGGSFSSNEQAQWNWGFQIEGSYHFNTGNDVTLSWYHIDTSWKNRGFVVADPFDRTDRADDLAFGVGHKNRWDAVNGEFGQFVDFSANKKIRFHGGFQFASIKRSEHAGVVGRLDTNGLVPLLDDVDVVAGLSASSQYNGFGPRTGIDMNYWFGNGVSIYAKAATVLLVGTAKGDLDVAADLRIPDVEVPRRLLIAVGADRSRTAIVPELEAKLGAMYTYAMAQGDLMLDVGYEWINYFNPLHDAGVLNRSNDFGLAGVYFGLKYVGNV